MQRRKTLTGLCRSWNPQTSWSLISLPPALFPLCSATGLLAVPETASCPRPQVGLHCPPASGHSAQPSCTTTARVTCHMSCFCRGAYPPPFSTMQCHFTGAGPFLKSPLRARTGLNLAHGRLLTVLFQRPKKSILYPGVAHKLPSEPPLSPKPSSRGAWFMLILMYSCRDPAEDSQGDRSARRHPISGYTRCEEERSF